MKIYTGNFGNVKKYNAAGLHPISIAISARYFGGDKYRPLNPDRSFMQQGEQIYTPKFAALLSKLDPKKVVADFEEISKGNDVVLLCHEAEGDFCHRRLVADWLRDNLHIEVRELGKMQKPSQRVVQKNELF